MNEFCTEAEKFEKERERERELARGYTFNIIPRIPRIPSMTEVRRNKMLASGLTGDKKLLFVYLRVKKS